MSVEITEKITRFMSQYPQSRYKKGQVLIFACEPIECVYYLLEGQIRQYDISYRGDEVVVNALKAPALFPLSPMLSKTSNPYFFEAVTTVEVCQASPEATRIFLHDNPDVMFDLLGQMCIGQDDMLERLAHIMGGSARSRVLYELLTQSRLFGEKRRSQTYIALNESELAARSGLSRETVSREVHKLKEAGLVDVSRKGIILRDRKVLEEKLHVRL